MTSAARAPTQNQCVDVHVCSVSECVHVSAQVCGFCQMPLFDCLCTVFHSIPLCVRVGWGARYVCACVFVFTSSHLVILNLGFDLL